MLMVLPADVRNFDNCMQWIDKLKQISPVKKFEFVHIKQSMMNAAGPACLPLKVLINNTELEVVIKILFLMTIKLNRSNILSNRSIEIESYQMT